MGASKLGGKVAEVGWKFSEVATQKVSEVSGTVSYRLWQKISNRRSTDFETFQNPFVFSIPQIYFIFLYFRLVFLFFKFFKII